MQSMAIVIVTFAWMIIGFSISFDQGNDWLGGLKFLGLNHVGFVISKTISPSCPSRTLHVIPNDVLYYSSFYFIRFNC